MNPLSGGHRRRPLIQPRAGRPTNRTNMARHPCPGGPSTRQRRLLHRRVADRVGFVSSGPRSGESAARAAAVSLPGAGSSSRLSSVCVSVVMLAVPALGVVRLGGRRWPACRCSRGRRPTGCDSEATGPLAAPLQRHPSGDGGRLTRTRLRPACRLQRPCSLPRCSCQPSIVGVRHPRQRPVVDSIARTLLAVVAASPGADVQTPPSSPGGLAIGPRRVLVISRSRIVAGARSSL